MAAWIAVVAVGAAGGAGRPDGGRIGPPEPLLARDAVPLEADRSAYRALVSRVRQAGGTAEDTPEPAPPLPGSEWNDPDSVNWAEVPESERGALRERLLERRGDRGPLPGGRLLERLRNELRSPADAGREDATPRRDEVESSSAGWPDPTRLVDQLAGLTSAAEEVGPWATATLEHLRAVQATAGPADPAAAPAFLPLGEDVDAGDRKSVV